MVWLRGSRLLSLLSTVSLCLCVSPSLGTATLDAVELKYPRTPMFGTEGMPLRLTCKAEYETKQCGRIDAFWCRHSLEECPKLIDPSKYLTIVNEMFMEDRSVRHRHVITDFIQLTPADQGVYQCHALKNPKLTALAKYPTVVKEAVMEHPNIKRKEVVTEIKQLNENYQRLYQCQAHCESGDSAMGDTIVVSQSNVICETSIVGTKGFPYRVLSPKYVIPLIVQMKNVPNLLIPKGNYLTVVNETIMEDSNIRRKDVVTEIKQMTQIDQGLYGCVYTGCPVLMSRPIAKELN
ncbi:unnamed protein product [Coregonus sp. 'balchen']|nr:unnamed protein product [Coregonus sp. 'balchen']